MGHLLELRPNLYCTAPCTVKTNMASRPRRVLKKPQRLIDEFANTKGFLALKRSKKQKLDKKLYEIEVKEVYRDNKRVRIHYKGYDSRFDEWRDYGNDGEYFPFVRQEKPHVLTNDSIQDRASHFIDLLYRGIKRSLSCGRKDDPDVRVEVDIQADVFNLVLANVVQGVWERGKIIYKPTNRDLDTVLEPKWDERIVNFRGDFCFVAEGTIKYWLCKRSSIIEYKLIGGKYVKSEIEGCCILVFTSVKGTGNRVQYNQRE